MGSNLSNLVDMFTETKDSHSDKRSSSSPSFVAIKKKYSKLNRLRNSSQAKLAHGEKKPSTPKRQGNWHKTKLDVMTRKAGISKNQRSSLCKRERTSRAPQSPNSSQQERKNSSDNEMGAKKSKQNVPIPYTVKGKDMGDSDYRELIFEYYITLGKAPVPSESKFTSESMMNGSLKKLKAPTVSLNACLQATMFEEVFFYALMKMPNQQNTFLTKRYFTTGLQKADNNMEHIIRSTAENEDVRRMVVFYICREDKKSQYESHVNKAHALIKRQKIESDFYACYLEKEPFVINPNTIYFFYTASTAAFEIKHQSMNVSSKVEPECITIDHSPEPRSLSTATTSIITPPIKPIKQEVTSALSPKMTSSMPKDRSTVWDTTDGSLKTKKRKLSIENQTVVKEEKGRIAELQQELHEAKEEIRTLKKATKKHLENLVEIHKILKYQPNNS